jgi:uncharacterized membrane protein
VKWELWQEIFMFRHCVLAASAVAISLLLAPAASANVTVCNEFLASIHVAFANETGGSYTASGWWTVAKDSCQDVDFTLQGDTLYYAANSDDYKVGRDTKHDHWGNKVQLFVSTGKFNLTNAEKNRRGAKPVMFSSATATQQTPSTVVAITVHFKSGGTSISFTSKQ